MKSRAKDASLEHSDHLKPSEFVLSSTATPAGHKSQPKWEAVQVVRICVALMILQQNSCQVLTVYKEQKVHPMIFREGFLHSLKGFTEQTKNVGECRAHSKVLESRDWNP
jgi:hypothetical protein